MSKYITHVGRSNMWIDQLKSIEVFGIAIGELGYAKRTQPELLILDLTEVFLS